MKIKWIAERILSVNDLPLQVRIAAPILILHPDEEGFSSGKHPNWVCHYEISMNGVSERFSSRGFDSWMALICGLIGACTIIDKRFPDASWMDYEHPGMHVVHALAFRSKLLQRDFEKKLMEAFFEIRDDLGSWQD